MRPLPPPEVLEHHRDVQGSLSYKGSESAELTVDLSGLILSKHMHPDRIDGLMDELIRVRSHITVFLSHIIMQIFNEHMDAPIPNDKDYVFNTIFSYNPNHSSGPQRATDIVEHFHWVLSQCPGLHTSNVQLSLPSMPSHVWHTTSPSPHPVSPLITMVAARGHVYCSNFDLDEENENDQVVRAWTRELSLV